MFGYLKLFLISAVLCNFLLLLPEQTFFNHFPNTSVYSNLVSKYSFVKLKSGFARPLGQTISRGVLGGASQSSQRSGLRSGLGSSQAVARTINKALGASPNSGAQSTGAPSRAASSVSSSGSSGPTLPRPASSLMNPTPTSNPQQQVSPPQSQNGAFHSSGPRFPSSGGYGPGSRPLVRPVGYISTSCPGNPHSQHLFRPGSGGRKPCRYCD
ncbi:hypothetical protein CmeUKMEL1_17835 [Cryptosporidium meleagridis]|uniref:Integral membrane protein n=1 Tax=Cryptosporidium meleagridis TaxID=93969 RepID=A0A2P4Z664_9CRYT|nr:hypothetical protein CmeUKMEL1_17835 [Cryptosporidium meleagridis]